MKTILKFSCLYFLILGLYSCQDNNQSSENNTLQKAREDSLKLKLEISPYKKVELNSKADALIKKWPVYEDFKNEVDRLKNYTIQDVISNMPTIEKTIDSLQKTVPKEVDTFPVNSRIKVLYTKAKFLKLLSDKQQPRLNQIKAIIEEYPLEFNALNIQLNEVFIELPEFEN